LIQKEQDPDRAGDQDLRPSDQKQYYPTMTWFVSWPLVSVLDLDNVAATRSRVRSPLTRGNQRR
jgi:hypothetical protein